MRMPPIESGPLQGFYRPDYEGGSTLNLMASLIRAQGGDSPHRELQGLPGARLKDARQIVLLIVDGVGHRQLESFLAEGRGRQFFSAHPRRSITTVYPATTAAAVTTLATGASPAEHGVLGWYLQLPDLGCVSTILPVLSRTGMPLVDDGFDLAAYLGLPAHLNSARRRRHCLSFGGIATSRFSRAGTRWDETAAYDTLGGMVEAVAACASRVDPLYAYVYWPEYDLLCHEAGTDAPRTRDHLDQVDTALAEIVRILRGRDAVLLVAADHGLVNTPPPRLVNLAAVPGLYDCLAMLPSGDARSAICFVRPRREEEFLKIARERLSEACVCVEGAWLLEAGLYGPGRPHPALRSRLGDYVLLARGDYAFSMPTWRGDGSGFIGNHGGMSETEVRVPLYALEL